jgi:hypothetical protein
MTSNEITSSLIMKNILKSLGYLTLDNGIFSLLWSKRPRIFLKIYSYDKGFP